LGAELAWQQQRLSSQKTAQCCKFAIEKECLLPGADSASWFDKK
jgi:hypothetical protein